ncbi:MAG: DNA gyrase subunit A [Clostridiales bacterium]|nr:DNA gyrase subunit A [Clostridiales bacterium]
MKDKTIFEKIDNTHYIDIDIEHEMKESFIAYAMAVNVSRAIPDVRDGLKPVHRRIMYSMHEKGLTSDKPFRKCAKIVGDVLGSYHPHGDSSVYDALVRLAQNFTINEPLVDGHGNFGSVDGDEAAAYRYTEARMSKIANELLRDINKDTVDFIPNFDASLMEPKVLPSRFPNLLVNGSDGIAVGMATNIPPHNLNEVINAVVAMIDNPSITIDEIMEYIPAPDFPTGGEILANNAIREAYRTGHGGVVMRAKTDFESFDDGKRWRIIVTAIPYQVNKAKLVKQIATLVKEKKIDGITYVGDQSSGRGGMRIVIELRRDANPQVVLNHLYKQTQLQMSSGIIMLALANGEPKVLNLQEMIFHYLQFQREIITRRTKYDLMKAEERAHILEGLVVAVNNIDAVIKTIKESSDKQVALANLMQQYDLTERQANAILEMKLSRLTGLEIAKLKDELKELELLVKHLKEILSDKEKVDEIIKNELLEIKAKYPTPRKTEIIQNYDDIDIEDLIERHDVVISLTSQGYIKRLPVSEYRSQNRGGRGVNAHKTKEEDYLTDMFVVNSHDKLMFFSSTGKVYVLKAYMIPEAGRQNKGRALVNLLPLEGEEKINTIVPYVDEENAYLVMATKNGQIKKTRLSEFDNVRKNGKIALKLIDDDVLIGACIVKEDDELMVASDNGKCLRFSEKTIRLVGRGSQGVKGMKIEDGENIVDMIKVEPDMELLTVTEKGYAKRTHIDDYRVQGRRGKGIKAGNFTDKTGKVVTMMPVLNDKDILAISADGVMIRTHADTINLVGRGSMGVRLMKVSAQDKVVSVAIIERAEDEIAEGENTVETENKEENQE